MTDSKKPDEAVVDRAVGIDRVRFRRARGDGSLARPVEIRFHYPTVAQRNAYHAKGRSLLTAALRAGQAGNAAEHEKLLGQLFEFKQSRAMELIEGVVGLADDPTEEQPGTTLLTGRGADYIDAFLDLVFDSGERVQLAKPEATSDAS